VFSFCVTVVVVLLKQKEDKKMASKLNGSNDSDKLKDLCTKTHKEQAVSRD